MSRKVKAIKILAAAGALILVAIQFFRLDFGAPGPKGRLLESAPEGVGSLIRRTCSDCHSYDTEYPWYSNVAPASWLLADHIRRGRSELNFDDWEAYPASKRVRKLDEICEVISSAEMPLESYLWLHPNAELKEDQIRQICEWATTQRSAEANSEGNPRPQ